MGYPWYLTFGRTLSRNISRILDPKNVDRRIKNNNYRYPCKPPTSLAKYTLSCCCNYVFKWTIIQLRCPYDTSIDRGSRVFFLNIVYIHSLLYNIEIYNIIDIYRKSAFLGKRVYPRLTLGFFTIYASVLFFEIWLFSILTDTRKLIFYVSLSTFSV